MEFVADFHIHSKYSRATSSQMDIENLSRWARWKGIRLLGTGDFTHPVWLQELKEKLQPAGYGLFQYNGINFVLTTEVSNIFYSGAASKRIHIMIFAPSFEVVESINRELGYFGKLSADGRPMLGLEAKELVKMVLSISPDCLIVPGHIWTPWYSLFGANSGFDSIEECFQEQTKNIFALETGLSSDPAMNWRWSALDKYTLLSNSDAHSPTKLGREANVFHCPIDYKEILDALKAKDGSRFLYTVEFFPQEGKYHWDGHRMCDVRQDPKQTRENNFRCPKCGRQVTVGVMHRVEKLCDREEGFIPHGAIGFKNLVPLIEIIAEARGKGQDTAGVQNEYKTSIQRVGSEFDILLKVPKQDLEAALSSRVASGILKVREGKVKVLPGYDGVYGKVQLFDEEETREKQLTMF